jgi:cytochrome b561
MAWRNTSTSWGLGSKLLHWGMALLIIGSAIFVLHINDTLPWFKSSATLYITYIHWHKAFGLLALALVLLRFGWKRAQLKPETAPLTPFERKASLGTHHALYALMIIVPLSGWIASSLFGSPTKVFGWFTVPGIVPKNRELVGAAYWAHFITAWSLLALVTFHAAAAWYHHLVRKDAVLSSMWFWSGRGRADR